MRKRRTAAAVGVLALAVGTLVSGVAIGSGAESPSPLSGSLLGRAVLVGDTVDISAAPDGEYRTASVGALEWSTLGITQGEVRKGDVRWSLVIQSGPGKVHLSVADQRVTAAVGGEARGIDLDAESSGVADLTFEREGRYVTTWSMSLVSASGVASSAERRAVIRVEDPPQAMPSVPTEPVPDRADGEGGTEAAPPRESATARPPDGATSAAPGDSWTNGAVPTSNSDEPTTSPGATRAESRLPPAVLQGLDSGNPADVPAVVSARSPVTTSSAKPVVLDDVHVDVAATIERGALQISIKDGTKPRSPVYRSPESVVWHVKEAARITVPANSAFRFLGKPGDAAWVLPQAQQADLLWPGWNTESLGSSDVNGPVTWRLSKVDGPGSFALFVTNGFGAPTVRFNSGDGLPDAFTVPVGVHAHGNWAFGQKGTYRLTFEMSATLRNGKKTSDTAVVAVAVGNVDPRKAAISGDADSMDSGAPQGSRGSEGGSGTAASGASGPLSGLAATGFAVASVAGAGALLIAVGAGLRTLSRRRASAGGADELLR